MLRVWVGGNQLDTVNTVWALTPPALNKAAAVTAERAKVFMRGSPKAAVCCSAQCTRPAAVSF